MKEGPSDDKGDGKLAEEMFDNVECADDGESKTERERHEEGNDLEDKNTDKMDKELMNREEEEGAEGGTTADEEVAMEKDPPDEVTVEEKKELKSSEIEDGEGNPVDEKESNDERAEEESGDVEEEERDTTAEKAEISEEGEETEKEQERKHNQPKQARYPRMNQEKFY